MPTPTKFTPTRVIHYTGTVVEAFEGQGVTIGINPTKDGDKFFIYRHRPDEWFNFIEFVGQVGKGLGDKLDILEIVEVLDFLRWYPESLLDSQKLIPDLSSGLDLPQVEEKLGEVSNELLNPVTDLLT